MNISPTRQRRIWFAVAAAMVVGGCQPRAPSPSKSSAPEPPTMQKVAVGVVRAQLVEKSITLPATVVSDETAMLMARVEAYVGKVLVDIGDQVKAGQVLVQLTAPELQHRVEQHRAGIEKIHAAKQMALAELEAAKAQLAVVHATRTLKISERDRLARLVGSGAIDRQRLEEAEAAVLANAAMVTKYENAINVVDAKLLEGAAELAVTNAKLGEAESQTDYLQIKAPFSGIVVRRNVDPGNLVRPAQDEKAGPLLTVAKVDKLRAILYATTDIAGELAVGQTTTFVSDDSPDQQIQGQLSRTAGAYDDQARMMRAEIDLPNARDPLTGQRPLKAGAYGSVTIVTKSATLPVVPPAAIRRSGGKTSVVVVRDGTCQITPVEIAIETEQLVGIAAGIVAGDQVVLSDPEAIKADQKLNASEIDVVNW